MLAQPVLRAVICIINLYNSLSVRVQIVSGTQIFPTLLGLAFYVETSALG